MPLKSGWLIKIYYLATVRFDDSSAKISEHHKGGLGILLRYDHRAPDKREILSDVVMSLNGKVLHHLHTVVDANGHIESVWQVVEGKPTRQLTRYFYVPDESSAREIETSGQKGILYPVGDLLTAQDEHGHHRLYQYRNHLITRYTDRTERGMNLEWDGEEANARAIREYADDGSFDTRLEWDKTRRRTIVTDALGNETIHHLNPLGYTTRITHPDGREEWFHRDAKKNIIRHQHSDGTSDVYRWSQDDELLLHTRPDGGTAYFEYDDQNNLTGIQDAEGGVWKRE